MVNKIWLGAAAALVAAIAFFAAPRVAGAFRAWEAAQHKAAILAARAALDSGADWVDLTALLIDPTGRRPRSDDGGEPHACAPGEERWQPPPTHRVRATTTGSTRTRVGHGDLSIMDRS